MYFIPKNMTTISKKFAAADSFSDSWSKHGITKVYTEKILSLEIYQKNGKISDLSYEEERSPH